MIWLMMYMAVCDDNISDLERIKNYTAQWLNIHREPVEVESYKNSGDLLLDIEDGRSFDIILCDIEMPKISGMEIAKLIRKNLPYCIIIFITSYIRYAVDAFELNIFRFIPKDCMEQRLSNALKDALFLVKMQQEKYYVIEHANKIEKIAYQDVIYMQKDKNYTIFYLKQGRVTRVRKSLKNVLNELEQGNYELIQRDIAVNLLHVVKLESGKLILIDNICLPVSGNRQDFIKNKIAEFWKEYL